MRKPEIHNELTMDAGVAFAHLSVVPCRDVARAGRVTQWPASEVERLLTEADRVYWDFDPPPGLDGFELAAVVGQTRYRIEGEAPRPDAGPRAAAGPVAVQFAVVAR